MLLCLAFSQYMERSYVSVLISAALIGASIATSSSSCSDLGWTNAALYGSASVCGEADLGLGACSRQISFVEADEYCRRKWGHTIGQDSRFVSLGPTTGDQGRLCTLAELLSNSAQDAACGLTTGDMVWSNNPCGTNGFFQSDGSTSTCVEEVTLNDEVAWARCCADQVLNRGDCSGYRSWQHANHYCDSKGARLCTLTELQNDEARDTGCNYDRTFVWSSTPCTGNLKQGGKHSFSGYHQAHGSSEYGTNAPCVANTKTLSAHVVCCADV